MRQNNDSRHYTSEDSFLSESSDQLEEIIEVAPELDLFTKLKLTSQRMPYLPIKECQLWSQITDNIMFTYEERATQPKSALKGSFKRASQLSIKVSKIKTKKNNYRSHSLDGSIKLLATKSRKSRFAPSVIAPAKPPLTQNKTAKELFRRKSCLCQGCGIGGRKQIRLPDQICEIHMHKKIRLANILFSSISHSFKRKTKFQRTLAFVRDRGIQILKYQSVMELRHDQHNNVSEVQSQSSFSRSPSIRKSVFIKRDGNQKKTTLTNGQTFFFQLRDLNPTINKTPNPNQRAVIQLKRSLIKKEKSMNSIIESQSSRRLIKLPKLRSPTMRIRTDHSEDYDTIPLSTDRFDTILIKTQSTRNSKTIQRFDGLLEQVKQKLVCTTKHEKEFNDMLRWKEAKKIKNFGIAAAYFS